MLGLNKQGTVKDLAESQCLESKARKKAKSSAETEIAAENETTLQEKAMEEKLCLAKKVILSPGSQATCFFLSDLLMPIQKIPDEEG